MKKPNETISLCGSVTINLFTSKLNASVERFYFKPQTLMLAVTITFFFQWQQEYLFAFLPFTCIPQVLSKNELEYVTGIFVVPVFTIPFWFMRLLRILESEPLLLKSHTSLSFPKRLKNLPNTVNFWLRVCHISEKSIDRKKINEKLHKSLYNPKN